MKTVTVNVKKELSIYPCVKCGNEDIAIYNCGYSSFNSAGGKCKNKKCDNNVNTGGGWNVEDAVLIEAWNKANNPKVLIEALEKQQATIQVEIDRLKALKQPE